MKLMDDIKEYGFLGPFSWTRVGIALIVIFGGTLVIPKIMKAKYEITDQEELNWQREHPEW